METLISFLIAFAVTFYFVRRYLKNLVAAKKAAGEGDGPAPVVRAAPCPRCGKPVPEGSAFCGVCGAPLALWNVHRAEVQEANGNGRQGKPRPVINASLCIGCGSCVDACPETGTLALAGGKAILAHPERCVGHAKCVEVCPTSALSLAFGNVLQTLKAPRLNENFETNVPGLFIVGELGGMGLIKTAINEGKLVIEHLRRRLQSPAEPAGETPFDVIIAGAGPAGLSASLAAHQAGLRYVTLEQGEVASTIRNYPRHKFLMAEPVEMPLYGSLYIGDTTKEGLLSVWETIIANTGVEVRTNERVESIRRNESHFVVETGKASYAGRFVVLALGKRGTPRRLGAPGEDSSKVAYRLIEAESYSGRNLLVVGGGDSAVEAALAVSKAARNRVTLSYRGAEFNRCRERNRHLLEQAESSAQLRVLRNSQVREILPEAVHLGVDRASVEVPNDYVFVLIGGQSPEEFLRKTGVEIVEKVITA